MHVPSGGAFGAAARKTSIKEVTKHWQQIASSLQGHWVTASNCSDKQAQGDDYGVAPQTHNTERSGDE